MGVLMFSGGFIESASAGDSKTKSKSSSSSSSSIWKNSSIRDKMYYPHNCREAVKALKLLKNNK